ncbi:MAG: outer membrane lipoprotein-sorting protein [Pseudomonadota bacterium]
MTRSPYLCRCAPALLGVFCTFAVLTIANSSERQAHGQSDAATKGLEIAKEASRRDDGFGDSQALLTMAMTIQGGQTINREMRQKVLEVEGDGDKIMMVFDRPRDLKGTAILTFTHKREPDEQWVYLPALKRVKRISSADRSGPFMGSEFAYEDLSSQEVEKYSYLYLRDEEWDGQLCFVVERTPIDPNSGYTRQITWIDQQEYRPLRVDYYDRKNELLKTMTASNFSQYLNQYWRPAEMVMYNHQNGKQTSLLFSDYNFRVGTRESDFTPNALTRAR